MIIAGFSNINVSEQIAIAEGGVFAGISRANQTISVYHGETLILDCTMPSTGLEKMPTIVMTEPMVHDESFAGFIEGETYTIQSSDGTSVTGFVVEGMLTSFDVSNMWIITTDNGTVIPQDYSRQHTNFSVSQNVTTVKKRYDIKLLPEDLLPKTVAKKVDVQKVQKIANTAQSTANAAQSTANAAQRTANTAQSTAQTAQSTADAAMGSALWGTDAYLPKLKTINIPRTKTMLNFSGYHLIPGETYTIGAGAHSAVWNGSTMSFGAGTQMFTITWEPEHATYTASSPSVISVNLTGKFMPIIARSTNPLRTLCKTPSPYVAFPVLNFVSQTLGSTSFIKMEAHDGPIIQIYDGKNYDKLATRRYADDKALGMDITGASAGQIIKIKSVDANGKPTEWESVDIVNLLPIYDGGVS